MKILQITAILVLFSACTTQEEVNVEINTPTFKNAVAVVTALGESGAQGIVTFEAVSEGVSITAEFTGLEEGSHGFHIHQYGNCTASNGTSAGGHFNPGDNVHSNPEAMNRHMGDMGNIIANSNGEASKNYVDSSINIAQIIGRGIIVHAGEDDLTSQPSGAAGSRIACGVIGIAE